MEASLSLSYPEGLLLDSLSPSYWSLSGVSQRCEPASDRTELPGEVRRLLVYMSSLYSDGARLLALFSSLTVFMMFLFCSLMGEWVDKKEMNPVSAKYHAYSCSQPLHETLIQTQRLKLDVKVCIVEAQWGVLTT